MMDFCNLVLRKRRNVFAIAATILTSLWIGYYLAKYENVCRPIISSSSESHPSYNPQRLVPALDHGCYLQTPNFTRYPHPSKLLTKRNCKRKIPTALILGAALSGSTTLKSALSYHPDVVVPEAAVPFWDNDNYLDRMPYSLPNQIIVDEYQEFLYLRHLTKETVKVFSSDLKVIILIRDPVARAVSEYMVLKSNNSSQLYHSLSKYLDESIRTDEDEVHTKSKRNVNTCSHNDHRKGKRKGKHPEKNKHHRAKRNSREFGQVKNVALHRVRSSEVQYHLKDTFEETILKSSTEINSAHFLVQRSIYGSGIKNWAEAIKSRPPYNQNILVLDADNFARNPVDTMGIVERFLGLTSFFHKDFFKFDPPNGVFCFNSPVHSCVEPIPLEKPQPIVSEETVALLRDFYIPSMRVQNRYSYAYFPHLGEYPLVYTPFR